MKKNNIKNYAKALADIASPKPKGEGGSGSTDKKVKNFLALVKKNGLERKLKEIVEMAENIILAKKGNNKITLLTARKITASQKKLLQNVAKDGDRITEKINPEIIAGVKIIINDSKQFDASMQKKLQNIF